MDPEMKGTTCSSSPSSSFKHALLNLSTESYVLYGWVDVHVEASLCRSAYFDVRVNYFTGTFLMRWRVKHIHTPTCFTNFTY